MQHAHGHDEQGVDFATVYLLFCEAELQGSKLTLKDIQARIFLSRLDDLLKDMNEEIRRLAALPDFLSLQTHIEKSIDPLKQRVETIALERTRSVERT